MELTVTVPGAKPHRYPIIVQPGLFSSCGEILKKLTPARRVAVVTDSNVAPLHLQPVLNALTAAGFTPFSYAFKAGEPQKTLETVQGILQFFCENRLTRQDLAIALGGGVCGDLTGFAAAIYLRGIHFVQLPTTLLAQVDSSVGGKTGCDLPFGKNLCGAFHLPLAVLADTSALNTLPQHFWQDGLAEVIKAGAILKPGLFSLLEQHRLESLKAVLPEVLREAIGMKVEVTERDFTEQGDRILLNFGHTLGHAIEKYQNFNGLSHGQAVAVGMALITRATEAAGYTALGTYRRLCGCLTRYGLPLQTDIAAADLCEISKSDKKAVAGGVRLVYLKNIGSAAVLKTDFKTLLQLLEQGAQYDG